MFEIARNIVWGPATILLIVLLGVVLCIKTKFRAIKNPVKLFRDTLFSPDDNKSSYEAMCTALGGTIGVGNTIGVAGAMLEGGPGALLWMVIASFFGMVIKESEIYLAVTHRPKDSGFSGPMYYIENGLKSKHLAKAWAISCIFTAFGMGNFAQSMSSTNAICHSFDFNKTVISAFMCVCVIIIISSGANGIKKFVSKTIPILSVAFVLFSITILILQRKNIPEALYNVAKSGFSFGSGFIGVKWAIISKTVRAGFSRGIFTNEAGLGSASIVHSSSNELNPEKQAKWGVIEVFIDTVLICTLTGIVILSSDIDISQIPVENITASVFENSFGKFGQIFYTVSTYLFALASILAWYYYAKCAMSYLGFKKCGHIIFNILFASSSFLGGIIPGEKILLISDVFNGLMLLINSTSLLFLSVGRNKN